MAKQNQQSSESDVAQPGAIELTRAERIQLFEETWEVIPLDERTTENQQLLSQLIQQGQVQDVLEIQDYYLTVQVDNSQHYQTSIYAPTWNFSYVDNSTTYSRWTDRSQHHMDSSITETHPSTEATPKPDVFIGCSLCLFVLLVACILAGPPPPYAPITPVPAIPDRTRPPAPGYPVPVVPIRSSIET